MAGTSVGAYAICPYPFGQKIETLKRCGFKKESCLFDRQGRGVSHTPSKSGMMGPGRLPCLWWGASPHQPPPPFLVLTQEKEAKESQGYGCQAERRDADAEIRKTCVATLRFGHSDFRARPCNSSFRALGSLMPFSGLVMVRG